MLRTTVGNLGIVIGIIALMALIQVVNSQSGGALQYYGILPRSTGHSLHVLSAPFIHGDYSHLINNALGLLVFGGLTVVRSRWLFFCGSLLIIVLGGALVWIFGRHALHFGASGWIYGLWALTISIAWFDRKLINILIAVLVLLIYGGMSYGLLPLQPSVSFEMHLAGVIAGIICAFLYRQTLNRRGRK